MRARLLATLSLAALLMTVAGCPRPADAPTAELPSIQPRPAQPVTIPDVPRPAPDTFMIYLKFREPAATIDRMGAWTELAQPTLDAAALRQHLAEMGIDADRFHPGRDAVVAFWPQVGFQQGGMPMGAILPLDPEDVAVDPGDIRVVPLEQDQGVLLVSTAEERTMARVEAAGPAMLALLEAPMAADIELFVDVEGLMTLYGPMMRMFIPGMMGMAGQDVSAPMMEMVSVQMTAALDMLDQARSAVLRADFGAEAVELSTVLDTKPGTPLSHALTAGPVLAPELPAYLDPADWVVQITMRDLASTFEGILRYIEPMMPGEPDAADQIRRQLASIERIGAMTSVQGISMAPGEVMQSEHVATADDPDAVMELYRTMGLIFEEGPIHDLYAAMGIRMRVEQEAGRNVRGFTVERYRMTIEASAQADVATRQMIEMMYPEPLMYEQALVGDFVVATMGTTIDPLIGRLVEDRPGEPAPSVRAFPAGAVFYLDFDLAAQQRAMMAQITGQAPEPGPPAPVNVAGYHQGGRGWYRVQLTRGTIEAMTGRQVD